MDIFIFIMYMSMYTDIAFSAVGINIFLWDF